MSEERKFNIATLKRDPEKVKSGVWAHFGGGFEVKVASFWNAAFREAMRKRLEELREEFPSGGAGIEDIDDDRIPAERRAEVMLELLPQYILLDWKNLQDEDEETGEIVDVPYTPEAGFKYLSEYDELVTFVLNTARKSSLYRAKREEVATKNS